MDIRVADCFHIKTTTLAMLILRSFSIYQSHVPQIGYTLGDKCVWLLWRSPDPDPFLILHLREVASRSG